MSEFLEKLDERIATLKDNCYNKRKRTIIRAGRRASGGAKRVMSTGAIKKRIS